MRKLLALPLPLLILLAASSAAVCAEPCPVKERELLGTWSRNGDSGFFQEFQLETDAGTNAFSSWLHQRPELSGGAWRLDDHRLVVTWPAGESAPFRLKVVDLQKGLLILRDESDQTASAYVRLTGRP